MGVGERFGLSKFIFFNAVSLSFSGSWLLGPSCDSCSYRRRRRSSSSGCGGGWRSDGGRDV